ncbi:hippurate hydrolase [Micromonospora pallida]|uniref:Hippurate hydrolase n=1 Tax=Micromonospora pallida TaxID=145854 RepID=A0A1C6SFU6_9ACTN|nr:amidohydrolase [Micromonospora pallida]SCL28219.1 hippurate hydrolase [Micromonospora pallida]
MKTSSSPARDVLATLDERVLDGLVEDYRWFHAHPELGYREFETAGRVAERLSALGYETHTGVGGTGVLGVLRNGDGPVIALRADMDALPILEQTGLDFASTATQLVDGAPVPLMHACGHDIHVTSLLGAASLLAAARDAWSGVLVLIFQPAEEGGLGAQAVVDSGIFDRVPRPEVVLGQHVDAGPLDELLVTAGPLMASSDSWRVVLRGKGGHGAWPHQSDDLVLAAANAITMAQNVVARQTSARDSAVVTIANIHIGTKENILANEGYFTVNIRALDPVVRARTWESVRRTIEGALAANGVTTPPEYVGKEGLPPLVNDAEVARRVADAFGEHLPSARVTVPDAVMGSEDFGIIGERLGVPHLYWFIGSTDPARYADALARDRVAQEIPRLHDARFAPEARRTLDVGVRTLTVAALAHLGDGAQ